MDQLRGKLETEAFSEARSENIAVRVQGVNFAYRMQGGSCLQVLTDLSFEIPYGQVVGLVGRNASGKSTLLSLLRGLIVPQRGDVQIGSSVISSKGRLIRIPETFLITQRADAGLAPTMTVYENYVLTMNRGIAGLAWAYSKKIKERCMSLLYKAEMGLEDKLNEQVRFLSGGQKQALSVLLSLECPDLVLLLDEPTASLDGFSAKRVMDLAFSEMNARGGAVILVSHRINDILERCHRVLVINSGRIVADLDNHDFHLKSDELTALME